MKQKKRCGRLGDHLSHYWMGSRVWEERLTGGRFIRPTFWCNGKTLVEGGHGVH